MTYDIWMNNLEALCTEFHANDKNGTFNETVSDIEQGHADAFEALAGLREVALNWIEEESRYDDSPINMTDYYEWLLECVEELQAWY